MCGGFTVLSPDESERGIAKARLYGRAFHKGPSDSGVGRI